MNDAQDALSRRRLLAAAGLTIGLGATGCADDTSGSTAATAPSTPSTPPASTAAGSPTPARICVLTPELTEGPYYVDEKLIRQDITEGKPGFPLHLELTVVNVTASCAPVAGSTVELWHCDAYGYYSSFTENSPGGTVPPEDGAGDERSFLRGAQPTDADGVARFTSIVPGWYDPRVMHIHVKVQGSGGDVRTTQIIFPDEVIDAVRTLEPYSRHRNQPVKKAQDSVYNSANSPESLIPAMTQLSPGSPQDGYRLTMTLGVA